MQTYPTPNALSSRVSNVHITSNQPGNESTRRTCTQSHIGKLTLFFVLIGTLLLSAAMHAQSPVPAINQPLKPATVSPGAAAFVLTVNGTGFVQGSVVQWNGSARQTHFVSSDRLTARILAADIAQAGTASVSVASPSPGGGTSNVVFFPINQPERSVSLTSSDLDSPGANILVCAGDFNRDGIVDLASTDYANGMVRVFLGNGDGTFVSFSDAAVPWAHGLAQGDFNGDGVLDLVVAPLTKGYISILLGNGDGTFSVGGTFATRSGGPYFVTVGDFNADGKLDVVTTNALSNDISVLLGNGDGTFQNTVNYDAAADARQVAVGDFNRDGKPDLAVASDGGLSILLGNGDGTFQRQTLYLLSTTDNPNVITADLNRDSVLDVAIVGTSGVVSVLLGNGDGSFQSPITYATGGFSSSLIAADFNGDGKLDLATGNYYTSNLSVLLGRGDGTFRTHLDYPADLGARGLAVGDFDGDGRLDLAVANQFIPTISIFLQF